jgi:hypothetical protein
VSNGNQNSLIVIQRWGYVGCQLKKLDFFMMIETFLNKGFLKTFDIPSSLDVDKIEKNRSASDEPTPSNGD